MRTFTIVAIVAFAAGCPQSVGSTGASVDAAASLEPTNAADITHYPYEKKLKDVPATLLKDGVVHKSPPDGPVITTLSKGTTVTQVAQTSDSFLVVFDDSSSGGRKIGWILENAFTLAPPPPVAGGHGGGGGGGGGGSTGKDAGPPPPAPGGGTIFTPPVNGQCPAGFAKSNIGCHKTCGADGDCPAGTKCKAGVIGSTKVCTTG